MICEKFAAEGANVAINFVSSKDRAEILAKKLEEKGIKTVCIQGDAGVPDDNRRIVEETVAALGVACTDTARIFAFHSRRAVGARNTCVGHELRTGNCGYVGPPPPARTITTNFPFHANQNSESTVMAGDRHSVREWYWREQLLRSTSLIAKGSFLPRPRPRPRA